MNSSRVLSVVFSTFILATSASLADELHLVAQGLKSMADVAPIYSCLAYQGCDVTTFTLGASNRLHIFTPKSLAEVAAALAACDLTTVHAKRVAYLAADGKTLIPLSLAPGAKRVNLSPAIESSKVMKSLARLYSRFVGEATEKRTDDAISTLNINKFGYETSTGTLGSNAAAVTDHQKKTVVFESLPSKSEFTRVVRHEFDHVLQIQLSAQCQGPNTFDTHERRERAAYLNDSHFQGIDLDWYFNQIRGYPNPRS